MLSAVPHAMSIRLVTLGVIKSDAGIEFHVNFCHPNPMKPAMHTLDEQDIALLQRIKRHPLYAPVLKACWAWWRMPGATWKRPTRPSGG